MALASWLARSRTYRSGRHYKRSLENEEDVVRLDLSKDAHELAKDILESLSKPVNLTDARRLNYLNALVKLILHVNRNINKLGYSIEDLLHCLKVSLVLESTIIRSGALRAIRYTLNKKQHVLFFNQLLIPYLLSRSLDLAMKNDVERIEAMKLIRKVLLLSPQNFEMVLAKSLVSLANGGFEEKDRMLRVCLAALSELGILNSEVFISCGGVAAITRNLLECQTPKIAESLCGVLLLLLDRPLTRHQALVDLHCVAAPYCDFHYRHDWMDKNRDERELRFNCSRLALLSILRSWPGILHFCSPMDISGLKAIVDVLYLNQLEVRKAVLDLLYELLNLPQPEWTDELSVALSAVDPAEPQTSWRLTEGFVAAEGRSVLPHLARTVPNISDMHLSLLLYCFLETGLLDALSTVIATSDTFISVRATVLLGELLRLIQILLPPECCNITPALPNLIGCATTNKPQALRAVTALQQLHKLLKRRPASSSLFLDYILQSGDLVKKSSRVEFSRKYRGTQTKSKLSQLVTKEGDDEIKETGVLLNKDAYTWNWNIIRVILRGETTFTLDLSSPSHRSFLRTLIHFYTPSSSRYSHMDLLSTSATSISPHTHTIIFVDLLHCLIHLHYHNTIAASPELGSPASASSTTQSFCVKLLYELFEDVSRHVAAITGGKSAHDCLFSPQHMANTHCQSYFLLIGRLDSADVLGRKIMDDIGLYKQLEVLATNTHHENYVKLIVSCFDYRQNTPARDLLIAILRNAPHESSRLYATQFLLVLLRASPNSYSTSSGEISSSDLLPWLMTQLTQKLSDKSRTVYLCALSTLHEACEGIPECLDHLVRLRPDLGHLGERGVLLLVRIAGCKEGYDALKEGEFLVHEIGRWEKYFNYRYVFLVEGETSDALTLHQKGEDGRYDKRASSLRSTSKKDLFLPPHLFGQLSRYSEGFHLLLEHASISNLLQCLYNAACETEQDILNLKVSLWTLAHLGTSTLGFDYLQKKYVFSAFVTLAESCVVYSVRATAFYALGLLATTKHGADHLFKLGWVCTRHDRHERWPIIEEENWEDVATTDQGLTYSDSEHTSSDHAFPIEIADADSSTTEELLSNAGPSSSHQQKSLTLPANQSLSSTAHSRSISESKTFDVLKVEVRGTDSRHRENSFTDSTTSGVSSCESVLGKSFITDKIQTLSPIPSSSSLTTLKPKVRRYSESSKTSNQSGASTDRYMASPLGSSTSRLSYQDRIGYATIRQIKRPPLSNESDDDLPFRHFSRVRSLDRNAKKSLSYWTSVPYSSYMYDSHLSVASLSRIKKPNFNSSLKKKGQCYMGICLPMTLANLFPVSQVTTRRMSLSEKSILYGAYSETSSESSILMGDAIRKRQKNPKHDSTICMKCSLIKENIDKSKILIEGDSPVKKNSNTSPTTSTPTYQIPPTKKCRNYSKSTEIPQTLIKLEVLKLMERLGNPLLIKTTKQTLLSYKQQKAEIFQDLCLYSDVCFLLGENAIRLGPRKFVHELFLDVRFDIFAETVANIFQNPRITAASDEDQTNVETVRQKILNYVEQSSEDRKLELAQNATKINISTSGKKKRVVLGFNLIASTSNQVDISINPVDNVERFSPTRFIEPRSPPLTSVKEETITSTENLLDNNSQIKEIAAYKTDEQTQEILEDMNNAIKTLDSLKLICNENKFPIRKRANSLNTIEKQQN